MNHEQYMRSVLGKAEKRYNPWNDPAGVVPWISTGAIEWLDDNLNNKMVGLEYGAGASTIWFAKRLKKLFTVEANPFWAVKVMAEITNRGLLPKWRLFFVNSDWQEDDDGIVRFDKSSGNKKQKRQMKKDYLMFANAFKSVDFVLVDGAIRYDALVKSVSLLKKRKGAVLCVDNMENPERKKYVEKEVPSCWQRLDFSETNEAKIDDSAKKEKRHGYGQSITTIFIVK